MTTQVNPDRLGKLLALASSDNDAEALAALRKAKGLLDAAGTDFVAVAGALQAPATSTPAARPSRADAFRAAGFRVFNADDPADMAEYRRQEQDRRAATRARTTPERDAVIARHGSEAAVLAPTEWERRLAEAVAPLLRRERRAFANGAFEVSTLDGWSGAYLGDALPASVRAAVAAAYPLPASVAAALAEQAAWEARWRDLDLVSSDGCRDFEFDLPVQARRLVLEEMIERDAVMPARTAADIRARLQYIADAEFNLGPEMLRDVLAAFDRVLLAPSTPDASAPVPAPVQSEHLTSAAARRAQALALLSDPDTTGWSDRAIARAVGISPTTVGALRRRLAITPKETRQ